jgi:hypothetical protein
MSKKKSNKNSDKKSKDLKIRENMLLCSMAATVLVTQKTLEECGETNSLEVAIKVVMLDLERSIRNTLANKDNDETLKKLMLVHRKKFLKGEE